MYSYLQVALMKWTRGKLLGITKLDIIFLSGYGHENTFILINMNFAMDMDESLERLVYWGFKMRPC
ncbi:MAG: hypothetical protein ACJA0H_001885 [Francisellaceae bacterium]|jgi:hypothetical protein